MVIGKPNLPIQDNILLYSRISVNAADQTFERISVTTDSCYDRFITNFVIKFIGSLMGKSRWEHFEHQADIGVRGIGDTPEKAFEQAALAMCAIITDLSLIDPSDVIDITCEEPDQELLLVDWLNAIIFEMSTRKMLFSQFDISINNGRLTARAQGEAVDVERHQPAVEIKGATYTELSVYEKKDEWIAQCVVDV